MGSPSRVATYNPLSMLHYKRASRMIFWSNFDPWNFLQSSARAARRTFRWNSHRSAIRPFTALAAVIGALALIFTSILEDSAKGQFAALNHYREETRDEQRPYTSRHVFTISCSVPSTSLQVSEIKTLTTSSNGSVNELTSVDTDVYRSSVAMPLFTRVSLVFQVWLPQMFAQHPLQLEDTIQHVKIIKGMYSDILLNVISWLCRTLFSGTHQLFMASQKTLALITYLCPRAFLPHITSCTVWRRAGDTLQIIQTNQRRDHRPMVLTIRARLAYEGAPCAQRHLWDQDKIFAVATQGINRNTFINDVGKELQRRISDNTSLLDVDVKYEWLHTSMRKAAEKHFTR